MDGANQGYGWGLARLWMGVRNVVDGVMRGVGAVRMVVGDGKQGCGWG